MRKINCQLVLMFIVVPTLLFSQKYRVDGGALYVNDTTYYNYKSVNYIGGELNRIDKELQSIKSRSSSNNPATQFKADPKLQAEVSAKLKNFENTLSELKTKVAKSATISLDSNKEKSASIILLWLPWIGILGLGALGLLLYNKIRKSMPSKSKDYSLDISKLESKLNESSTANQTALLTYINDQMDVKKSVSNLQSELSNKSQDVAKAEIDHSLALKLADEINRMEKNLSLMDKSVKGHRQMVRGVSRLKDNISANGYEISDLLGKPFKEGMKLVATYVPSGSKDVDNVITSILKPQVLFNGQLIQAGQVEVSQN